MGGEVGKEGGKEGGGRKGETEGGGEGWRKGTNEPFKKFQRMYMYNVIIVLHVWRSGCIAHWSIGNGQSIEHT